MAINGSHIYASEWRDLFLTDNYLAKLKEKTLTEGLRSCRFRSVCWKIFLECLPEERSQWIAATKIARQRYTDLKEKYIVNPWSESVSADLTVDNPLSQEEASPWNQYFQDGEIKVTIKQDVVRTFPEIEYFQTQEVRDLMVNILFCYAREYPEMMYKQGMHELLAPLIFILHFDHQSFLHASEIEFLDFFRQADRKEVKYLLDPNYLEHDAFCMLSAVMEAVEPWYLMKEYGPAKTETVGHNPFARPQDVHIYNVIIGKLSFIHDVLLKRHDPQLYAYLEKMEIVPQIFGIRWLRLLFGREFPLQDLLVLWDVIFADSSSLALVDYIFVAMLIFIRDLLLNSDYANSLMYLMRYPTVTDVHYIVDQALHLREPFRYPKPSGYPNAIQVMRSYPTVDGRREVHRAPTRKTDAGFAAQEEQVFNHMDSDKDVDEVASSAESDLNPSKSTNKSEQHSANFNFKLMPRSAKLSSQFYTEYLPMERELRSIKGESGESDEENSRKLLAIRHLALDSDTMTTLHGETHGASGFDRVSSIQDVCLCCAQILTTHIDCLQSIMLQENLKREDDAMLALAGIKQVRDILKGSLKCNAEDLMVSSDCLREQEKRQDDSNTSFQ